MSKIAVRVRRYKRGPKRSVHRHSQDQDIWWIFNPTAARVTARASLQAAGVPYQVDLWSGAATRMAEWTSAADTTSARLSVAPHASMVLVVRHSETGPLHVVSSTVDTLLADRGDQTGPTPLASAPSGVIGPVTLSNVLRVPLVGQTYRREASTVMYQGPLPARVAACTMSPTTPDSQGWHC